MFLSDIEGEKMSSFKAVAIAISVLSLSSSALADMKEFYAHRALGFQKALASDLFEHLAQSAPQEQTYSQRINHSDAKDMRIFQQRYWFNDSYATSPNAPVVFYVCGEATCSEAEMVQTVLDNARKLGAYGVALEHRYYGKSQPFTSLTTENLKYLTIENALADLASFEEFAKEKYGLKGKWISAGGSYPGALSAFYRATYPEEVSGALASSAPVQAKENFEDYDRHVFEVAGTECATVIRAVVKSAEDSLSDDKKLSAIKKAFAAEAITDADDFLYLIADVGASAVQYGLHDEFCKALVGTGGDVNAATTAYGNFAQRVYAMFGVTAFEFSFESAENTDPDAYLSGFGYRQWMYQSCTEFGFFQNAYHDPAYSVRSARINPEYHRNLCKRLFGIDQPVNTAATNARYYAKIQSTASNILLTNGSEDPWSLLGINPELGNNTNPALTAILIQGTAHCADLHGQLVTDSPALHAAKQKFLDLAAEWVRADAR